LFDCDADGYPMEGIWLQKLNDLGEINDLTVYLRPYPAVTVLRNRTKELGERLAFWSVAIIGNWPRQPPESGSLRDRFMSASGPSPT
jgi:hypothetical protein